MFDEFGPRGAEDEREGFWTVPPAQEPYGPGIVPPEES